MKKRNQTTIEQNFGERTPDKTKEYVIGNTVYIVNSFFAENDVRLRTLLNALLSEKLTKTLHKNMDNSE